MMKRMKRVAALGVFALTTAAAGTASRASVTATMTEVGGNSIVVTGGGTVNLAGLSFGSTLNFGAGMSPTRSTIILGPTGLDRVDYYTAATAPAVFGTGSYRVADTGSGDLFGLGVFVNNAPPGVLVPDAYVSGSALSFSSSWLATTYADMGITPGEYVWSWGEGESYDTFTLNILPVPEPGAVVLLGVVGLGLWGRRGRSGGTKG